MSVPRNIGIFLFKLTSPRTLFKPTKPDISQYAHAKATRASWYCEKYTEMQ